VLSGVDAVVLTDSAGFGVALVAESANFAWEKTRDGIVVSHNAMVAGRGNKNVRSDREIAAGSVEKISGSFLIVPVGPERWPEVFASLFGSAEPRPKTPNAPYYAWYD